MEMFDIKFDSSFVGQKKDKRKAEFEAYLKKLESAKDTVVVLQKPIPAQNDTIQSIRR